MNEGVLCENRTGTDTKAITPYTMQFDLEEEFPILTCKSVGFKTATIEMLWIYQAASNDVRWLWERNNRIWDEWVIDEAGNYKGKTFGKEFAFTIGTAYGWIINKYDLLRKRVLEPIKNNPTDRRMVMSLWQDAHIDTAVLPSCVWSTEWRVLDGKLNVKVNQRSCDVALGLPFNITQYAVLANMIAHVTGLKLGKMTWTISDAHIYVNQFDGIREQLSRRDQCKPAPKLWLNPEIKDFYAFDNSKELNDIKLIGYEHLGKIEMEVSV
jgi:thymidylate synthase